MRDRPEHIKLEAVHHQTQFVYDFIEFCRTKGVWMSRSDGGPFYDFDKLLYEFIEVDPVKLEKEKIAMLKDIRKSQAVSRG